MHSYVFQLLRTFRNLLAFKTKPFQTGTLLGRGNFTENFLIENYILKELATFPIEIELCQKLYCKLVSKDKIAKLPRISVKSSYYPHFQKRCDVYEERAKRYLNKGFSTNFKCRKG